jgi:hypothetical protein
MRRKPLVLRALRFASPALRRATIASGLVVALRLLASGALLTPGALASPSTAATEQSKSSHASPTAAEFFARSPHGGITCAMYDGGPGPSEALCESYSSKRESKATLEANGRVVACASRATTTNGCDLGNAGEDTPTLGYGKKVTVGRFRCVVERQGVKCTVLATGKGFLFNPAETVAVGGAQTRSAPLQLREFTSPDGSVWCVADDEVPPFEVFCGATSEPPGSSDDAPERSAIVNEKGKVAICFAASPSVHGCFQNWNPAAPVLQYGQEDEVGGFRCSSKPSGITCVELVGPGAGRGFRIDAQEAKRVD